MERTQRQFFATAPRGLASVLADELRGLGLAATRPAAAGVAFRGGIADAYRVCLWARTASRVLMPLTDVPASGPDDLYQGASELPWEGHLRLDRTFAVEIAGAAEGIGHSHFAALRVKDAVVDRLRARLGSRPNVDPRRPDLRVHVHLRGDRATLSLDLAGESLHQRGYRVAPTRAPLKESLAAGILLRAGWPRVAAAGGPLVDPVCGSGTLPIEAALIAGDVAPGLSRAHFGFLAWTGHEPGAWAALLGEARERARAGLARLPLLVGYDQDPDAVAAARANARAAGLGDQVRFERRAVDTLVPPAEAAGRPGLLVANPPYGARLGGDSALAELYARLGERLRAGFVGWEVALFTGNPSLAGHLGLRARRRYILWNGPIACELLRYRIEGGAPGRTREPRPPGVPGAAPEGLEVGVPGQARLQLPAGTPGQAPERPADLPARSPGPGASMFTNRLSKNLERLGRWARRADIDCYRVYDADMPEYAVAIDLYQGVGRWVHIQEYAPPATVDPAAARTRLDEVLATVPRVLGVAPKDVYLKVRRRQRGGTQYGRQASRGQLVEVRERECRFLVNLTDYLDTGLFLDHRETRRLLAGLARGQHFLNLFAYTGTATVCAARAAALSTTSIDLSRTYLDWARRNLELNGQSGPRHQLVQADCLAWLEARVAEGPRDPRYGLIFLDPPTFSRSKRMTGTLDTQRDHVALIRSAARLLAAGGILIFSTNQRTFRLDRESLADLQAQDITAETLPLDFARNPRIHQCWRLQGPSEEMRSSSTPFSPGADDWPARGEPGLPRRPAADDG